MRELKIVTGTANVELAKLIASCNQVPLVRALNQLGQLDVGRSSNNFEFSHV